MKGVVVNAAAAAVCLTIACIVLSLGIVRGSGQLLAASIAGGAACTYVGFRYFQRAREWMRR